MSEHTIELWTIAGTHFAECSCGWQKVSAYQPVIESFVSNHRRTHQEQGESTEVV